MHIMINKVLKIIGTGSNQITCYLLTVQVIQKTWGVWIFEHRLFVRQIAQATIKSTEEASSTPWDRFCDVSEYQAKTCLQRSARVRKLLDYA